MQISVEEQSQTFVPITVDMTQQGDSRPFTQI